MNFICSPSLVLYLPLHELDGSSFMSRDAYGHLCTVTGALWRLDGHYFDGSDDRITIANHSVINPTAHFTIELWAYLDPLAPVLDGTNCYLFDSGNYSTEGFMLMWDDRGIGGVGINTVVFNMRGTSNYSSAKAPNNTCSVAKWYHLVGTYDKDAGGTEEHQIYIDAVKQRTADFSETLTTTSLDAVLGMNHGGSSHFGGRVGEFRFYSRALTPLEIQHNYLATKWRYR